MRQPLLTLVLITAFVWETATDTVAQNEVRSDRQVDVYDIPDYELMSWPQSRTRQNISNRKDDNGNVTLMKIYKILVETSSISNNNSPAPKLEKDGNISLPTGTRISNDKLEPNINNTKPLINSNNVNINKATVSVNKLSNQSEKPISNITSKPGNNINRPSNNGNKPVNRPVSVSEKPIKVSNTPVNSSNKPISSNKRPVVITNNKPISNSKQPVSSSVKPVSNSPKPVSNSVKPVSNSPKPVRNSAKPVSNSAKPVRVSVKPVSSSVKPVSNSAKPVISSVKPVGSSSKPNKTKEDTVQEEKPPARTPCTCAYGQCLCCTGQLLDLFQQKACIKIVYTPEDFNFDYSLLLNNRVMYKNKFSGKNPRPACIGMPRFNSLRLCAKFSNIYFAGRNVHMCLGLEGKWDYFELFSVSFDCLRMGAQGFAVVKPEEGGGLVPGVPGGLDSVIEAGGDDIEEYDENVVRSAFSEFRLD